VLSQKMDILIAANSKETQVGVPEPRGIYQAPVQRTAPPDPNKPMSIEDYARVSTLGY